MKPKRREQSQARLPYIDLMESLAIYFVLIYHSTLYPYDFLSGSKLYYLAYLFRTILPAGVPLFFFVNGYLLFRKPLDLKKHIRKTVRLTVLSLVWAVISLLVLQGITQEYLPVKEFFNALWTWKPGWINHLWYMGALVVIYVFFPLLKQVFDTNRKIFVYFTMACAVFTFGNTLLNEGATIVLNGLLGRSTVLETFNFFNIFNPFREIRGYAFVYFCIGGLASVWQETLLQIPAKKRNIMAVVVLLISCLGLWGVGIFYSHASGAVWDLVWNGYDTVFTFACVICIYVLCLNWKRDVGFVRALSGNTLGIYFMHRFFIQLTRTPIKQIPVFCNIPMNLVYTFCILCICLGVSLLLRKIPVVSRLVE